MNDDERKQAERTAEEWLMGPFLAAMTRESEIRETADLIQRERAAARNEALSKAADACDRARPSGGRAWTEEQAACYEALSHVADHIRSLAKDRA